MAAYIPWITFFIGIFIGWLLTWLIMIGNKRDLESSVGYLEASLHGCDAQLASCREEGKNRALEYSAEIKALQNDLRARTGELEAAAAALAARSGELELCSAEMETLRAQIGELLGQIGLEPAAGIYDSPDGTVSGAGDPEAQGAEPAQNPELLGEWMIEYIYERPVVDNSPASIEFAEDGRYGGNASCNRYFGAYKTDGSNLTLGVAGATRKMCVAEAIMEQESRLLAALPQVTSYEISEGILYMLDEYGAAVFRAAQHE